MDINDLTPEQLEKAKVATSADELLELAKSEGIDLSDEQLDVVAGGRGMHAGGPSWSGD